MAVLLVILRVVRYALVIGAIVGPVHLLLEAGGNLALRIAAAVGIFVLGLVGGFALAMWSGKLAAEYAPHDPERRRLLITGKMGPPRSPHDKRNYDTQAWGGKPPVSPGTSATGATDPDAGRTDVQDPAPPA